jgi:hypothetical protein
MSHIEKFFRIKVLGISKTCNRVSCHYSEDEYLSTKCIKFDYIAIISAQILGCLDGLMDQEYQ